ncbi:glycosyl transferase family 2 [Candidatus Manganitrophus noduliformans]|uniref:Glycosyl transferase family 2 n=1 Tax=Candidatus Manganitrophus noduliformans TaxID=2606439 RepID=A0A7X6IAX2_9BACT|nr:glycosyl transferase family 2 [Candidatus Manganitrophus noduliformans]NKE71171.1 glycosyl transferase family 2 [Candidatus Manganitrophus noduliformans]
MATPLPIQDQAPTVPPPAPERTGADESLLPDDLLHRLIAVGEVDLLVGIPTLNHAGTVGQVVRAVQIGFVKYFPRERTALINLDGGSTDGTPEQVRAASIDDFRPLLSAQPLRTLHRITTPYPGSPGRDGALRTLLAAADLVRAKACAVVSGDLENITPEWIDALLRPVYKESFDLIAPLYQRHKFDGLLISNLIYPMVRAIYGHRIREPLGPEFGLSGRFARALLSKERDARTLSAHGIDLTITAAAATGGYRIGQSFLGPKVHASRRDEPSLPEALRKTVGALFEQVERDAAFWPGRQGSAPLPLFGFEYAMRLEPIRINKRRMLETFRTGVRELSSLFETILSQNTRQAILQRAGMDDKAFRYPDDLWVKTVYEFAAAFHRGVLHRPHLIQALTPLYLGRACSFVLENADAGSEEVGKRIEALCLEYERQKPGLIERWNIKQ